MKLLERQFNYMNTTITIKVVQDQEPTVKVLEAIENAFGEFDRIVKKYTRFNESSELSNLNRSAGNWVQVSDEFFSLIKIMLDIAAKSGGLFDPTIIDFLEIYGYDAKYDFSKLDNPDLKSIVQKRAKTRPHWSEIQLDEENKKVKLALTQKIDLGGIGKGYAIDCAHDRLKEVTENFLIDAGGDIRASGNNENGKKWTVGLKSIDAENNPIIISSLELDNESLASSGSWARKVKNFHHLINPTTGEPENKFKTVFVVAPTALESDSWATTLFVGGEKILERLPENYSYYLDKNE
jgi:thiamine biosynthesis lipoprotein